jgi:hypothetical protein
LLPEAGEAASQRHRCAAAPTQVHARHGGVLFLTCTRDDDLNNSRPHCFFPTLHDSQLGKGYTAVHASGFRDFLLKPELLSAIRDCAFEHPSEGGSPELL